MSFDRAKTSIVVVCEDQHTEVLLRRYLQAAGFQTGPRKLRIERCMAGCGEAFVRKRYPIELQEYRKRNPLYWALIVAIDADSQTLEKRAQQLAQSLEERQLQGREDGERVVHLIPKREIETWIHFLLGNDVNEVDPFDQAYKRQSQPREFCEPAAQALLGCVRGTSNDGRNLPPSLEVGINELRRLDR